MKLSIATAFLTFVPLYQISAWDPLGQIIEGIGADDNIGTSTAISKDGTRIVIGSPLAQTTNVDEGVARVYEIDNTGSWSQVGSDIVGGFVSQYYIDTDIRLGTSVDISADGKRIILGFPGNPFTNTAGRIGVWDEVNGVWTIQVFGNNASSDNFYGSSVAMCDTGKFIIIGSPLSFASTGGAYVYQEDSDGSWSSTTIYGGTSNGMTGSAVNISGDCSRVIVNGRTFDPASNANYWYSTTAVYNLFSQPYSPSYAMIGEIVEKGYNLIDDEFLTTSSNDLSDDGNRAIIGNANGNYAQVYDYDINSQWNQVGGDINGLLAEDKTGYRVGICGNGSRLIVGSTEYGLSANSCEQGRSQVFEYNFGIGVWQSIVDFEGNCDRAGNSVGISGDCTRVITGYPKHASSDPTMMEVGRVRVFTGPPVSSCGPCYEHPKTKFFLKINNGQAKYKNCKWLAKKSDQKIQQICNNLTASNNKYGPPRDVCPKTCGVCV